MSVKIVLATNDFANKTIVVLNNKFRNYSGVRNVDSFGDISKRAFLSITSEKNSRFLFIGNNSDATEKNIQNLLISTDMGTPNSRTYTTTEQLIRSLNIVHRQRLADNRPIRHELHKVRITALQWQQPTQDQLETQAVQLQRHLTQLWPDRRYIVTYDFRGTPLKQQWGRDLYDLGDLIVQQIVNQNSHSAIIAEVHNGSTHDPQFILSETNLEHLFAVLSRETKVKILDRLLGKLNEGFDSEYFAMTQSLVNALSADIALEFSVVSAGGNWNNTLVPHTLEKLASWNFANYVTPHTSAAAIVEDLYLHAKIAAHYSYSSYSLTWRSRAKEVYRTSMQRLDGWAESMCHSYSEWKEVRSSALKRWDDILLGARAKGFWLWNSTRDERIKKYIVAQDRSARRLSTDAVLDSADLRVFSYEQIRALRRQDNANYKVWKARTEDNLDARAKSRL